MKKDVKCGCVCIHINAHTLSDLIAYTHVKRETLYLDNHSKELNMVVKLL